MLKYIVKRIGMALATLLVIIFVLFVLVRIMPGNPFPSERMSATQIANTTTMQTVRDSFPNNSTNAAGPKYEPSYTGIPTDILTSAPTETSE